MLRFEKYQIRITCSNTPERIDILLDGREVGEVYVRDGELELRSPWVKGQEQEVFWREDISGWGRFSDEERDHYMHEAIRRIDAYADPKSEYGKLDPNEPVPEINGKDPAPEM